jgi:CubicO group peptidase (beta-lactamase class C family)
MTENPRITEAKNFIDQLKQESGSIGWAVTISLNNKIILSQGFGLGNYEQQIPVYPNKTRFRIGSISKALTAASLGVLINEGKIDLDKPVQKYAPYFPKKEDTITTRQVAGHLAGIRHYNGDEFLSSKFYKNINEGLDIFMNDNLLFKPGTKYSYSSYGFNLLSAAIEGASGQNFLDYINQVVFMPLGMDETVPDLNDSLIIYRAGFYSTDKGKDINASYVDNSYKWAGGGFLSTSDDLVKFGNAMLSNTLFPEKIKRQVITTQKTTDGKATGYGMGFFTGINEFGHEYYGHGGGSIGGCGNLIIFPDKKLVVAVITNDSHAKVGNEIHKLAEIFLKDQDD